MSRILTKQEALPGVSSTVLKSTESRARKLDTTIPAVQVLPVVSLTVLKPTESGDEVQQTNANIQHIIQWKEANEGIPPDLDKSTFDSEMRGLLNQWNRLQVENGTLLRQWRPAAHLQPQFQIVVTRKEGQEILKELHSEPTGGHLGVRKTAAQVKQRYYWPRWIDDVKHYVENCCSCNQRKPPAKLRCAPLQSMHFGSCRLPYKMARSVGHSRSGGENHCSEVGRAY